MGETETSELEISKEKPIIGQIMLRGDERPEQLKDKINWTAVGDYELEDENGIKVTFRHVYHDAKTIVIFIRHLLCFTAKEYVDDLAKITRNSLEGARVRLAIIGCSKSKFMKQFRRDTGYWAEFYTDPQQELYTRIGCKVTADLGNLATSKHAKSSAMMGIVRSAFRASNFPGESQGDHYQQGGAFILGPGDQCSFAHVDQNGADHYPINKLLDLVGLDNITFTKDKAIFTV